MRSPKIRSPAWSCPQTASNETSATSSGASPFFPRLKCPALPQVTDETVQRRRSCLALQQVQISLPKQSELHLPLTFFDPERNHAIPPAACPL